jgi:hypothetical protein
MWLIGVLLSWLNWMKVLAPLTIGVLSQSIATFLTLSAPLVQFSH